MALSENDIALEFLVRATADLEAGSLQPLERYLALYPGHQTIIEQEYARLLDGASSESSQETTLTVADVPENLAHYSIIRILGRGGQATVFEAEDGRIGRRVALKVFTRSESPISQHERLARFRREAEVAGKLDHPGICSVYDIGESEGYAYIAMRLVEGQTLSEWIREARRSALPPRDRIDAALAVVESVGRTLEAAHAIGVIHRDLKPGNIMLQADGQPVLLDFGLARSSAQEQSTLTASAALVGTPAYMSPEQIQGSPRDLDHRTDVYSLGVCLYEMLALALPHTAPTQWDLTRKILDSHPTPVTSHNRAVSRDLAIILSTAMSKDPARRYATAREFADDVGRLRAHLPIKARPPAVVERIAMWARRNPVVASLAFTLAAVMLTTTILLGIKNRDLGAASRLAESRRLTAERAASDLEVALAEVTRLSDASVLEELIVRADTLFPAIPDLADDLAAWIRDAENLLGRRDQHVAVRSKLSSEARPYDEDQRREDHKKEYFELAKALATIATIDRETSREISAERRAAIEEERDRLDDEIDALRAAIQIPLRRRFDDHRKQWQFDLLDSLIRRLDDISRPDGLLVEVRRRSELARSLEALTITAFSTEWQKAGADVGDDPRFNKFVLTPEIGLVPLGKDPHSGLQEFLLLESHLGDLPVRNTEGRFEIDDDTGIIFVLLPGGTFEMGAQSTKPDEPAYDPWAQTNEGPVHLVTLSPFFMSKYETTQAQFLRVLASNPSYYHPGYFTGASRATLSHPVEMATWSECIEMARRTGSVLPTEAQWEYAARGGTTSPFWAGSALEDCFRNENCVDETAKRARVTWVGPNDFHPFDDGHIIHAPVDAMSPNPFGLHHMLGNVREWVKDYYSWYRDPVSEGDGERQATRPESRVIRGGSYGLRAESCRAASRNGNGETYRSGECGFRLARMLRAR